MPETRREFLEETRAQVTRLTRLATDLLDLSRLDAGQIHVVRHEVDLADAARTIGEEFRVVADATEHRLELDVPDPVPALGDYERVLQIGRILVENALRHTPPGTRVLVVRLRRRRARGAHGLRRGARDPRHRAGAHLPAVLPRRRRQGVGKRAGPCDRP